MGDHKATATDSDSGDMPVLLAQALRGVSLRVTELRDDLKDMRKELTGQGQRLAALDHFQSVVLDRLRGMDESMEVLAERVPTTNTMQRLSKCSAGECPNMVKLTAAAAEEKSKPWFAHPAILPLATLVINVVVVIVLASVVSGRKANELVPSVPGKEAKP